MGPRGSRHKNDQESLVTPRTRKLMTHEKRPPTDTNTRASRRSELSDEDFKATLIKVIPQATTNPPETRKIENFSKEKEVIKELKTKLQTRATNCTGWLGSTADMMEGSGSEPVGRDTVLQAGQTDSTPKTNEPQGLQESTRAKIQVPGVPEQRGQ